MGGEKIIHIYPNKNTQCKKKTPSEKKQNNNGFL